MSFTWRVLNIRVHVGTFLEYIPEKRHIYVLCTYNYSTRWISPYQLMQWKSKEPLGYLSEYIYKTIITTYPRI